jgi:glycosyltransferase involved in cell wall biosynthesis
MAAGTFDLQCAPGVSIFFDVVDWVPEENLPADEVAALHLYFRRAAANVQGFFAVSEPLSEKLRAECGIEAVPVPNGADLDALRLVPPERVAALRQRLGLRDRFVIGYIGNHGSFTGVDFVVSVFEQVRRRMPDAALLIVGPAEYWRAILEGRREQGIVWTGPVPPAEVGPYFHAIDIGVLAQEKTLGTEFAFQLKNVEYTACRKFVVSTPLLTWQRLRWPNILLTDLRVDDWVGAICGARERHWSPGWDSLTDAYDWTALAARMANAMLGVGEKRDKRPCAS